MIAPKVGQANGLRVHPPVRRILPAVLRALDHCPSQAGLRDVGLQGHCALEFRHIKDRCRETARLVHGHVRAEGRGAAAHADVCGVDGRTPRIPAAI
eukprot:10117577-Lingulodinium_polyedra.AAC.1